MRPSPRSLRLIDPAEPRDWLPGESSIVLRQSKIDVTIHHVVWMDGDKKLYDQPLVCEPIGAICFIVDAKTGRLGLINAQRPLARDEEAYAKALPALDPGNLGRLVWEVPRGLPMKGETEAETAKRESEEETGGRVRRKRKLPIRAALNSTYFPQTVPVWVVEVDMSQDSGKSDPLEGIVGRVTYFTLAEYLELRRTGECVDAPTGDVISYLLLAEPGLLK